MSYWKQKIIIICALIGEVGGIPYLRQLGAPLGAIMGEAKGKGKEA